MSHHAKRGSRHDGRSPHFIPRSAVSYFVLPFNFRTFALPFYLPGIGNTTRLSCPSRSTAATPKK